MGFVILRWGTPPTRWAKNSFIRPCIEGIYNSMAHLGHGLSPPTPPPNTFNVDEIPGHVPPTADPRFSVAPKGPAVDDSAILLPQRLGRRQPRHCTSQDGRIGQWDIDII